MVWGFENISGMGRGGIHPSSLFSLPVGKLKQTLIEFKYVPNCIESQNKIGFQ